MAALIVIDVPDLPVDFKIGHRVDCYDLTISKGTDINRAE